MFVLFKSERGGSCICLFTFIVCKLFSLLSLWLWALYFLGIQALSLSLCNLLTLVACILQPLPLKRLTEGLKVTKRSDDDELYKLFTNVLCIHPPKVISLAKGKKLKNMLSYQNVSVSLSLFKSVATCSRRKISLEYLINNLTRTGELWYQEAI